MTVQEIVALKLGKNICPHIELATAEAADYIKNYCHITEIPINLTHVWANMAMGIFAIYNREDTENTKRSVSSISMGDTSYSFDVNRKTNVDCMEDLLNDYKWQLNRFRRGVFGDDT